MKYLIVCLATLAAFLLTPVKWLPIFNLLCLFFCSYMCYQIGYTKALQEVIERLERD